MWVSQAKQETAMKIDDWVQFSQDDLLDDSTIELFRQYLEEVMERKTRQVSASISWADY